MPKGRISASMVFLVVDVHEMFHPPFHASARGAAIAQIGHEPRIAHGLAAERRRVHAGSAQEDFDLADQHRHSPSIRLASRSRHPWSRPKSYLSRKNPSYRGVILGFAKEMADG